MGLTTERKVFLGLMVIAGASLIIDQAILSPSSASASSLDAEQIDAIPDEPILAGITKPITDSVTKILNDRLNKAAATDNQADQLESVQQMFAPLLAPPPRNSDQAATKSSLSLPSNETLTEEPVAQAPSDLPILSALMPSRTGQSGAILDATLFRVGETTRNGYRLISVEQRQVVVERDGREYWIILPAFKD